MAQKGEDMEFGAQYTGPEDGTQPMVRVICGKIVMHLHAKVMGAMDPATRIQFLRDLTDTINEHMNLTKYEVPDLTEIRVGVARTLEETYGTV